MRLTVGPSMVVTLDLCLEGTVTFLTTHRNWFCSNSANENRNCQSFDSDDCMKKRLVTSVLSSQEDSRWPQLIIREPVFRVQTGESTMPTGAAMSVTFSKK